MLRVALRVWPLFARCIEGSEHLKRRYWGAPQDEEYFGGLREAVLERDGHCCRLCGASGRDRRSITVHHSVPGKSLLPLMISLCPGCNAGVHHTRMVLTEPPPLLLELWREQHLANDPKLQSAEAGCRSGATGVY